MGRLHDPAVGGPCVVGLRGDDVVDLTEHGPTTSALLDRPDVVEVVRRAPPSGRWAYEDVLAATLDRRVDRPHFLAPVDLQVIKAAGVTFVRSLLERVVEEAAGGDARRASDIRERVTAAAGGRLGDVVPGSAAAERLRETLTSLGLWSQYLEVGLGPDPELFTKAPVLSAVGLGAEVGVLARSTWNNPEPETVLVASSTGRAVGATLGNDVNLRDLEGRSALLLAQAKDNNASCAIGPFVRHHEAPEFVRVAAPVYLKFGLRNAPDIYPMGEHLAELASSTARERVRRASLGLALLERLGLLDRMSPAGARGMNPAERFSGPAGRDDPRSDDPGDRGATVP